MRVAFRKDLLCHIVIGHLFCHHRVKWRQGIPQPPCGSRINDSFGAAQGNKLLDGNGRIDFSHAARYQGHRTPLQPAQCERQHHCLPDLFPL